MWAVLLQSDLLASKSQRLHKHEGAPPLHSPLFCQSATSLLTATGAMIHRSTCSFHEAAGEQTSWERRRSCYGICALVFNTPRFESARHGCGPLLGPWHAPGQELQRSRHISARRSDQRVSA